MNKFYRIFLLLIFFIFLSTFNPNKLNLDSNNESKFFKIKIIEINGNILIKESKIKEKLSNIYAKNIFFIKRSDIEELLKNINFFNQAFIKKKYPDTIIIKIVETEPIGIVFKNKNKYLIDSISNLITIKDIDKYNYLPVVIGEKAQYNFLGIIKKLKKNNFPINKIKKFYFFETERWNLHLLDSKILKLPSNNVDNAIKKSIELLQRKDFVNYKIIDLRLDGKIIVE